MKLSQYENQEFNPLDPFPLIWEVILPGKFVVVGHIEKCKMADKQEHIAVVAAVVVVEQQRWVGFAGCRNFHRKFDSFEHKQVDYCKCSGRKAGKPVGRPGIAGYRMECRQVGKAKTRFS